MPKKPQKPPKISVQLPSQAEMERMAIVAVDKIALADKPKVVVWNPDRRDLRIISSTTSYARDFIGKPSCLGQYDHDVNLKYFLEDFAAVLQTFREAA